MRRSTIAFLAFASIIAAARPATPTPTRPVVAGFERLQPEGKADSLRSGHVLLSELGCASCHETAVAKKQAPILDGVGQRVRVGWMRQLLTNPQAAKPGTTMPDLFAADPERAAKVEALVHFLASTGSLQPGRPEPKSLGQGRDLYHKVGCVACHGSRDNDGDAATTVPSSVPLGNLKAKYGLAGLAGFLENPHAVRPGGRMPRLLQDGEAKSVANYLLQGALASAKRGSARYGYYEGSWDRLPDFAKLKPVVTGVAGGFDLGVAHRHSDYGLVFEGFFKVSQEGDYRFQTRSDDGSRLIVDGKTVVDNDLIHPVIDKLGTIHLKPGTHALRLEFFQGGGEDELDAWIELPGVGLVDLGDIVSATEAGLQPKPKGSQHDDETLPARPDLVARGKELFASVGCANCHQLNAAGKPIASALKAKTLAAAQAGAGCLAAAPSAGVPWYSLDMPQRTVIAAALHTALPTGPAEVIRQTMTTFNCYACHVRNKQGGADAVLNSFFKTAQPEMGDEGRVPPPLDGVGAKLNVPYVQHLLDTGVHDRPYMFTRMPGFGLANVGPIIDAFAALDTLPAIPAVTFTEPTAKIKTTARHLVGGTAFGCVKCHTFNGIKAEGVQGIDMNLMTTRLKRDWFHAYVYDPPSIRPGTRMPSAFFQGQSALPEILDGKPSVQIEALWVYLLDGNKARPPAGIGGSSIPLVPEKSAIIYRNFIEGAGPRAIGVGYPEHVSLAFDANDLQIALLWQGSFIDAARHWTDRGAGFEGPAGDNVLHLPTGPTLAMLASDTTPWPKHAAKEASYRFLGYKLTPDDRPTFRYSLNGVMCEDFPSPSSSKDPALRRTLTMSGADGAALYVRAIAANKIESIGAGAYKIDTSWRMKIEGTPAVVRTSEGKMELLVPIKLAGGKASVTLEYAW